jgi:hypothetical protein
MTAPPAAAAPRKTTTPAANATDPLAPATHPGAHPDESTGDHDTAAGAGGFWRHWRWWLPVALLALALALVFVDPFAGDWDALDYTVLAVKGEPSTMLFGRMLFLFTNHLAYRIAHALFDLRPENAYLLFKYMVVAQSPLAVTACWLLARDVTGQVRSATIAALLLALSPFFILYSGQAMTEIPSLLLLGAALTVHLRGLRKRKLWLVFLGAALLGTGNNVREVAAIYGVWLVAAPFACGWRFNRRDLLLVAATCAVFFACAFVPWLIYYFGDVGGYREGWHGWVESMRMEEGLHPVSVRNFVPLFLFFFIAAPLVLVALPAAAWREWRERGWSPLLVLGATGVFANLMLITHYSTVINGRYLLTGLMGVVPLAADYFVRHESRRARSEWRGFLRAAAGVLLVGVVINSIFFRLSWPTIQAHGLTKEYRATLARLPEDAVVMAGAQTVSVTFYRGVGLGRWDVIGTGGGWPAGRLAETVDWHLGEGRRVFVDADTRWWASQGWQALETRELIAAAPRFRFRRVTDTVYEIRPADDETAQDDPNFERLLEKPPTRTQKLREKL